MLATIIPITKMVVCMNGYPSIRDATAINMPSPKAQKDMYFMNLFNSHARGEGPGSSRAANPATRPNAVTSPQHSTTPATSAL